MKTIIIICGIYSIAFGLFHILFWKIFRWKKELIKLHFSNRAIMQILNLRMIYLSFFVGFLCFYFTEDLLNTPLGKAFMIGMSIFWLGRTIEQFMFLRVNNRYVHLLTVIFLGGAVLFSLPFFMN